MKLHQLTLHAFGPFGGTEQIDFDRLGADGLFLLRGRTGAGKTSILDAVTFALYGDVPGQREKTRLKSSHASPESEPFVELEFTQAGRRCRIWRSPHHGRPQKRDPSRIREVGQRVVLHTQHAGEWQPYTSGIQAANDEITRMLGLDLHQFTKVILLPQGSFAEFLHASSRDKQELLERLFDTERFTLLERHLRELARDSEQQLRETSARIQMHAESLRHAAQAMLPEVEETIETEAEGQVEAEGQTEGLGLVGAQGQAEALAQVDEADLVDRVDGLVGDRRRQLQGVAESAAAAARQAREQREELLQRDVALRRHAEHAERASAHQAQSAEVAAKRDALRRHESAELVGEWFAAAQKAADQHVQAAEAAATEARRAAAELGRFAALQPEEITARDLVDAHGAPSLEQVQAAAEELISLRARLTGAEAAEHERRHRLLLEQCVQAERAAEQAQVEADRCAEELERLSRACEDARARLVDPESLEAARDEARTAAEALLARIEVQRSRDRLQAQSDRWSAMVAERENTCEQLQERHRQRLQSYLQNVAAQLAGELEEGQPCLVCGSAEHPLPAADAGVVVTRDEVEAIKEEVQTARDALSEARVEHRSVLEQRDEIMAGLGEHAEALVAQTEADLERARGELQHVEEQRAGQRDLREQLAQDTEREQRLVQQHTQAVHSAERRREAAGQQAAEMAELEAALDALRGSYESLPRRLEELHRVQTSLRSARRQIEDAQLQHSHLERARRTAEDQLRASTFSDAQDMTSARLTLETAQEHSVAVDAWEELRRQLDYEGAQEIIQAGEARHRAGELRPRAEELTAAEASAQTTSARAQDADTALVRFGAQHEAVRDHTAKLEQARHHRDTALAEQRRRAELAATINGTGSENTLKMTLTTYVLAARLERVAEAATRHLATMSEQRYRLLHSDDATGRGLQGLDLKVHDEHSDVERSTSSLSGGETFMASLAMALGLAEVVQSESGGIGMESLFIDEGFGSLDEDSLEHVMSALHRLQGEGRRVGLVSHVSEMHRAIPTQLRVLRHRNGSTTEMVTP
ncbi:AAA family ATPase [Nesterenkonia lutea]|uniref:Nuclease SbcCD subunit C n=1 Tax=Nesterenkonia lutea TaxID=272919 RepID=A0ABR9JCK4_9MICC|nr:AAA family ATPase [Nesterenkonia lutea]MBE1523667.1 exonuclease SbcC [Nesterenkonia lutea]